MKSLKKMHHVVTLLCLSAALGGMTTEGWSDGSNVSGEPGKNGWSVFGSRSKPKVLKKSTETPQGNSSKPNAPEVPEAKNKKSSLFSMVIAPAQYLYSASKGNQGELSEEKKRKALCEAIHQKDKNIDLNGVDLTKPCDEASPFFKAVNSGQKKVVKDMLDTLKAEQKAKVLNQSINGLTPLGSVIQHGQKEMAQVLIEAGADVDQVFGDEEEKVTPLSYAIKEGQMDIAALLVEKGADVNNDQQAFAILHEKLAQEGAHVNPLAAKVLGQMISKLNNKPVKGSALEKALHWCRTHSKECAVHTRGQLNLIDDMDKNAIQLMEAIESAEWEKAAELVSAANVDLIIVKDGKEVSAFSLIAPYLNGENPVEARALAEQMLGKSSNTELAKQMLSQSSEESGDFLEGEHVPGAGPDAVSESEGQLRGNQGSSPTPNVPPVDEGSLDGIPEEENNNPLDGADVPETRELNTDVAPDPLRN